MRTLAIGDIHGCLTALETLEEAVGFREDDTVVLLGDYVDRGPDSRGVLDWIIDRSGHLNIVTLRGNHEIMMLSSRKSVDQMRPWLSYGGDEALRSYGIENFDESCMQVIPEAHWDLLNATKPFHETDTHIFVHAGVAPDTPMAEQSEYNLFWKSFDHIQPYGSGKTIVCGHTSQKSGEIASIGHAVCIDTWACGGGWLTCLDVGSMLFWQADWEGKLKTGRLTL